MSCIVLIGGLIGCGKSTLVNFLRNYENELFHKTSSSRCGTIANNVSNEDPQQMKLFQIIFDDLCSIKEQAEMMKTLKGWRNFRVDLLMAAEYFISSACNLECQVVGPMSERSQNLLNKLESLNNNVKTVSNGIFLVEDNFYYRSMRYDWFQIARRTNIGFCEVFLHCPLNTAISRNFARGYNIPEQKIKMMISCMEYPNQSKYKWERFSMMFDSSVELKSCSLTEIVKIIEEAANNPAELMVNEEKIEAQRVCSKNAVHQADNILRKLISKKISSFKENISNKEDLKILIQLTVDIRQDLLNGIKRGDVHLPLNILEKLRTLGIEKVQQEYEEAVNEIFENAWKEKMMDVNFELANFDKILILQSDNRSE